MNNVFRPILFPITEIVAAFVAGPAIKKTNAAPGDTPFIIRTAAMGTELVAQIYTGIDATRMINIPKRSL